MDTPPQGSEGGHTYPVACTLHEETAESRGVAVILEDRRQHVTARVGEFTPGGSSTCFRILISSNNKRSSQETLLFSHHL